MDAQGGQYGSAVQAASENGHTDILEILLARGADVDAQGRRYGIALQVAADHGSEEVLLLLMKQGDLLVDFTNDCGRIPLNMAAHYGHTEIIKQFLRNGADVNTSSSVGWTPYIQQLRGVILK